MQTQTHYFEEFLILSNLFIKKMNNYLLLLEKAYITVCTCITYMPGCSSEFLRSLDIYKYIWHIQYCTLDYTTSEHLTMFTCKEVVSRADTDEELGNKGKNLIWPTT